MATVYTGDTVRLRLTATKDGAAWDLTGATVILRLVSPAGVASSKSATISSAASGVAHYDTLTTDLPSAGTWLAQWLISQSGLDLASEPEVLLVEPRL